jgi:pimeloyl-ACP methyl ester carboxylesterase
LLAHRYRVIAPDLIGFGESAKAVVFDQAPVESRIDHVADILHTLGEERPVHLVGCSFGGALGLRAIVRDTAPFAIKSVTSICGAGGAASRTELAIRELGTWDGTRTDLARILALLIDSKSPHFERLLDERLRCALQPGHYRAVMAASLPLPEALKSPIADSWPEQLSGTVIPLHLIRGVRDVLLTEDWAQQIVAVRPDAYVTEIDSLHAPQLDHAQAIADSVSAFLDAL